MPAACATFSRVKQPNQSFGESVDTLQNEDREADDEGEAGNRSKTHGVDSGKLTSGEELMIVSEFSVRLTAEVARQFAEITRRGFISMEEVAKKSITLPDSTYTNTLFLDLDDTLTHTMNWMIDYSKVDVSYKDVKQVAYLDKKSNTTISMKAIVRPFARQFLEQIKSLFEIVVLLSVTGF